jgi:uncharacterized protein YutE (UPF0331/DUF86 family)
VDEEVVRARLSQLEEVLGQLAEITKMDEKEFLSSWQTQRAAERCTEVAAKTCLDLANHLVASKGLRSPQGYADVFAVLAEAGIVGRELSENLKSITGLRNILVYEYWTVDHARLFSLIQDLTVFKEFAKAIKEAVWGS